MQLKDTKKARELAEKKLMDMLASDTTICGNQMNLVLTVLHEVKVNPLEGTMFAGAGDFKLPNLN